MLRSPPSGRGSLARRFISRPFHWHGAFCIGLSFRPYLPLAVPVSSQRRHSRVTTVVWISEKYVLLGGHARMRHFLDSKGTPNLPRGTVVGKWAARRPATGHSSVPRNDVRTRRLPNHLRAFGNCTKDNRTVLPGSSASAVTIFSVTGNNDVLVAGLPG